MSINTNNWAADKIEYRSRNEIDQGNYYKFEINPWQTECYWSHYINARYKVLGCGRCNFHHCEREKEVRRIRDAK